MRSMRPWLVTICYTTIMTLTRVVVGTFGRLEVHGRANAEGEGPAILIANHLHLLDPPLVTSLLGRRVHTMAKRELFETPLIGWVFWGVGAIPVRRYSADVGALRAARNVLKGGEAVLIFPEGTRSKGHGMQAVLPGAATVALLSGAPIVPVGITGTEAIHVPAVFFQWITGKRPRITVTYGEPFHLPEELTDTSRAGEASDYIMRRVAALLPEEYRGAYGADTAGTAVFRRSEVRPVAPRRSRS